MDATAVPMKSAVSRVHGCGTRCMSIVGCLTNTSALVVGTFEDDTMAAWLWHKRLQRSVSPSDAHLAEVCCLGLDSDAGSDSKVLVRAGHFDGYLDEWEADLADGCVRKLGAWRAHPRSTCPSRYSGVSAVCVQNQMMVTGGADSSLCLWSKDAAGAMVCENRVDGAHGGAVTAVGLMDTPSLLASAGEDGAVKVWTIRDDLAWDVTLPVPFVTGSSPKNRLSPVSCLSLDSANCRICAGADDSMVRTWDVSLRRVLRFYQHPSERTQRRAQPRKGVTAVACDVERQGKRLVSAAFDGSVVLWDQRQEQQVHKFMAHTDAITSVSLRGEMLLSASLDGVGRLWDLRGPSMFLECGHLLDKRNELEVWL